TSTRARRSPSESRLQQPETLGTERRALADGLTPHPRQRHKRPHDAAIVTWVQGKKKPKARQVFSTTGAGAAGGAFWGLLFGLLFFVPFFGMALGAAAGALAGSLTDFGINDDFIKSVREKVTEGTSALFLMSSGEVVDRVQPALAGEDMTLITTNLSVVDEAALKEMFSE
ncbi:MAG: DUF1269 domain-containing protein, partial [Acidimicrobiia bacterium]|nr:DUF1269 domain-containing protein [Acidimicrobiia bacterium]